MKANILKAVLAKGNRNIGYMLLEAFNREITLKQVLREKGIDIEELATKENNSNEILPWEHLDMGFSKDYLLKELSAAIEGNFTPMCTEACRRCGVCRD